MTKVKSGDKVKIHITGKLNDGEVFASSGDSDPIEIKVGASEIIEGVQDAVVGMQPKEKKSVKLPPEKGFGTHYEELVREVNRELLPDDIDYKPGKLVALPKRDGKSSRAKIVDVSDSTVTLDLNHPLAGKELVCEIELLEIR